MWEAIKLIDENKDRYPKFERYIKFMELAEQQLSSAPDVCVETCKSILEGVSKTVLQHVNPSLKSVEIDQQNNTKRLVSSAFAAVNQPENVLEDNFIYQVANVVEVITKVRNKRGDISHGRISPKIIESSEHLAVFTLRVTDSALIFLLEALISHEIPERIPYKNNPDFNEFLDQEYPLLNSKLIYSQALYELRYEDYRIQLENWRDD